MAITANRRVTPGCDIHIEGDVFQLNLGGGQGATSPKRRIWDVEIMVWETAPLYRLLTTDKFSLLADHVVNKQHVHSRDEVLYGNNGATKAIVAKGKEYRTRGRGADIYRRDVPPPKNDNDKTDGETS